MGVLGIEILAGGSSTLHISFLCEPPSLARRQLSRVVSYVFLLMSTPTASQGLGENWKLDNGCVRQPESSLHNSCHLSGVNMLDRNGIYHEGNLLI